MQTHQKPSARTIEPQDFLLPDPVMRSRPSAGVRRTTPVEDAVFEVVGPATRQSYRRTNDNLLHAAQAATPEFLPVFARFGGRLAAVIERQLAKLSPQAFMTLLSSAFLSIFWICGGFSALGASAPHISVTRPFALVDTFVATQDANGMQVAIVTGAVRNTSGKIIRAPRLAIVSGTRQEIIGTVSLPVDRIDPGMTIPFSGRFKLAGGKSNDITIIPERP